MRFDDFCQLLHVLPTKPQKAILIVGLDGSAALLGHSTGAQMFLDLEAKGDTTSQNYNLMRAKRVWKDKSQMARMDFLETHIIAKRPDTEALDYIAEMVRKKHIHAILATDNIGDGLYSRLQNLGAEMEHVDCATLTSTAITTVSKLTIDSGRPLFVNGGEILLGLHAIYGDQNSNGNIQSVIGEVLDYFQYQFCWGWSEANINFSHIWRPRADRMWALGAYSAAYRTFDVPDVDEIECPEGNGERPTTRVFKDTGRRLFPNFVPATDSPTSSDRRSEVTSDESQQTIDATSNSDVLPIVLASTVSSRQWSFGCPINIQAQRLIARFIRMPEFGFAQHDDNGKRIPYRLMWQQGNRYLGEMETLREAGVNMGDKIIMVPVAQADTIPIILASSRGSQQWSFNCPADIQAQRLVARFIQTPAFGFATHDDNRERIPYRLMWQQGNTYLSEAQTLREIGVKPGDTILMMHEARAGGGNKITSSSDRLLRVFLCHGSEDKPTVHILRQELQKKGVKAWLDEEEILPGQNWNREIIKAVEATDIVLVCLSNTSVGKTGYIQKEIKRVLDVADEKPDGTIFVIPVKLEECTVPDRLSSWQWVDYFKPQGFQRIMRALQFRAEELGIALHDPQ